MITIEETTIKDRFGILVSRERESNTGKLVKEGYFLYISSGNHRFGKYHNTRIVRVWMGEEEWLTNWKEVKRDDCKYVDGISWPFEFNEHIVNAIQRLDRLDKED